MKIRTFTFKCLSWTLIFFMAMVGLAQGAVQCKGKCCRGGLAAREKPVVQGCEVLKLQLNPKTPLEAFLPSCHLSGPSDDQRDVVSAGEPCQGEGMPSCCHMGKAGSGVRALASKGHSWGTDRLFEGDLVVFIQSNAFLNEDQRNLAVDGGGSRSRAAPVPLYLINTSFIC